MNGINDEKTEEQVRGERKKNEQRANERRKQRGERERDRRVERNKRDGAQSERASKTLHEGL